MKFFGDLLQVWVDLLVMGYLFNILENFTDIKQKYFFNFFVFDDEKFDDFF